MPTSKYIQINLSDLLKSYEETYVNSLLSSFSCPLNPDVQEFCRSKAIEFSNRGFAKTHLVFWQSGDGTELEFVGYYALAPKFFSISKDSVSTGVYKKLSQYGTYNSILKKNTISALLIGQLGKNYANGNDTLISGDELLSLALNKVSNIQTEVGGRYTYLECEDKECLLDFYKRNGFTIFGKRFLDPDESNIHGHYLIQLLKKIDTH